MKAPLVLVAIAVAGCGSNLDAGSHAAAPSETAIPAKLMINELQAANKDTITDEHGDADDWIEIYNSGNQEVDLKGFAISDSGKKQTIGGTLLVEAGGFVLLWADDSPSQGVSHLGFKLSASAGDSVTLADGAGKVIDTISFGPTPDHESYARHPDGTGPFVWCQSPTPGASNGSTCAGR